MPGERIDVHAHFVPEGYRRALEESGQGQPDGIKAIPPWSEEAALQSMDDLRISTAYLSISSPGIDIGDAGRTAQLAREVNEDAVKLRERNPGRFGFFASVPLPDEDAAEKELIYALDEMDADGLVLMTNTAGIYLGDDRLEPLYAAIDERHSVLFVHPTTPHNGAHLALGYPRPMVEFIFETTRSIADMILAGVLDRHPNMRVIVPHSGAALPILANRIELLLPFLSANPQQSMPSVKSALKTLHFDLAGDPIPELLTSLLSVADHDRIHYGSDFPFTPATSAVVLGDKLDATPLLGEELRDKIYKRSAQQLFAPRLS